MFDLRSKSKWYCPPGKWFYGPTPPPFWNFLGLWPTPLEFPIPYVVGVWIFSGTTHSIFLVLTINRTPLHWSAATGHAHCVALLLRLGSDKNTEDKHEALPLQYAQQGYHSACCKLLIDHDPSNPLATQIPQGKGTMNSSWLQAIIKVVGRVFLYMYLFLIPSYSKNGCYWQFAFTNQHSKFQFDLESVSHEIVTLVGARSWGQVNTVQCKARNRIRFI